jgi:hypothetical protein
MRKVAIVGVGTIIGAHVAPSSSRAAGSHPLSLAVRAGESVQVVV